MRQSSNNPWRVTSAGLKAAIHRSKPVTRAGRALGTDLRLQIPEAYAPPFRQGAGHGPHLTRRLARRLPRARCIGRYDRKGAIKDNG